MHFGGKRSWVPLKYKKSIFTLNRLMLYEMIGNRVGSKLKHYRKYFCFSTVMKRLGLRLTNRIRKFAIKIII